MINALRGKPKSHLTGAWMMKIQQKMKAKVEMEERLFARSVRRKEKLKIHLLAQGLQRNQLNYLVNICTCKYFLIFHHVLVTEPISVSYI